MDEISEIFEAKIDTRLEEHAEHLKITNDKASKAMHSIIGSSINQIKELFNNMSIDISEKFVRQDNYIIEYLSRHKD